MKINWKLRLQNRATLFTLIGLILAIVYQVLGWFGVIPKISIKEILDVVSVLLEVLGILGIIVDPTTAGVDDSKRAMGYEVPSQGSLEDKPELPEGYYESNLTEEELMKQQESEEYGE